jgi:hypothetical protein
MAALPPDEDDLDNPQSEGEDAPPIEPGPRDLETLYASALHVTEQWLSTYKMTGDQRHFRTALACAQIAREHYARLEMERRVRRLGDGGPFARRHAAFERALAHLDAALVAAE